METFAFLLLGLPALAYVGYPLTVIAAARMWGRPVLIGAVDLPVAVVICAHDEGGRIGAKLASVLGATQGMAARVIVADDGSTDDTAAVVASFPTVELHRLPRRGKAAALNHVTRPAVLGGGDAILVMTDADPLFEAETLPALLAPFADPRVGAVAGRVETRGGGGFGRFDALFRGYESAIRQAESDLFGCVSADGGLYAMRARLLPHVPADVTDDFYISTAAVAAGFRIAFAEEARAWEYPVAGGGRTLRRRVRITVRGLTGLWARRALMNPARHGWYAVALVLHKLARRLAPLTLAPLWAAAGLLATRGSLGWGLVFAGLSATALVGVAGAVAPERLPRVLSPVFGAALHLAGLAWGAVLFARGRRFSQWTASGDPA